MLTGTVVTGKEQEEMRQHKSMGSAALLALTLVIPSISKAQTEPPPQWTIVTTSQIRPEFRAEFESGQKELTAAYKKAGVPYRVVVQTVFGDVMEYTSITPLAKYADMDGPSPIVKALGEAGSQRLLKRVGGTLVSVHRVGLLALDDISIRTAGDPGEYVHVMTFHLRPGKGNDFTAFMKDDYLPALRKADVANAWLNMPVFGGDTNDRVMVIFMHKLAEIDAGPPTRKALGVEGARRLGAKQADIVASVSHSVGHVRADLSAMPAPPKSTD
jgi:hypothetical protein